MLSLKYKVRRIKSGSTIGVISPSWSGPEAFPVVYQKGVENLKKEFDFTVKEFAHTKSRYSEDLGYVHDRVADIHAAFLDEDVDAIFITIGGSDSIRLLPYLDKDILIKNPKVVMGFSDATSILLFLVKLGIPAFHGPSIMAGFSEPEGLNREFVAHFKSFFFEDWDRYEYPTYTKWTEDRYGWTDPNFLNRRKKYEDNKDRNILNGTEGSTEGVLVGGCLEVLEMLKGTPYGIGADDWENTTFFFETSEDKPSPEYVECSLISYAMNGAWDKVRNLLVSKARGYSKDEYQTLENKVKSVVYNKFNGNTKNILTNVDCGHTQPMLIFPMGCRLAVDGNTLTLLESPFNT